MGTRREKRNIGRAGDLRIAKNGTGEDGRREHGDFEMVDGRRWNEDIDERR